MDDAHGCASVAGGMDAVSDRIYSVSQMPALGLHPHLVPKVTQFYNPAFNEATIN